MPVTNLCPNSAPVSQSVTNLGIELLSQLIIRTYLDLTQVHLERQGHHPSLGPLFLSPCSQLWDVQLKYTKIHSIALQYSPQNTTLFTANACCVSVPPRDSILPRYSFVATTIILALVESEQLSPRKPPLASIAALRSIVHSRHHP